MSKTFSSWGALKAALQQELTAAMNETIDKSFQDAQKNVNEFYASGGGRYQRTGQLGNSPEAEMGGGGDSVTGIVRLNTGVYYNPAGRDTQTIFGYAENGGLLGNGGFWSRTEEDIQKNIQESFGKRFK